MISDKEKRLTAYHEGGHTLVGMLLDNTDPVHKVTIIPRGRAGGYTLSLPKEDRYYATRSEMLDELKVLLGGRVAEALVLKEISSGASNDLQRATSLARQMICEYGMSENIGPVTFGHRQDQVFLGRDIARDKDYSEEVAAEIDKEVRSFLEDAYAQTEAILSANLDKLHVIAQALIERETLEAEEIQELLKYGHILTSQEKAELGIHEAIATYSDFNTSVKINYYDPYDYHSFVDASETIMTLQPDGVMVAPTAPQYTKGFTDRLHTLDIPYIYIDSNIKDVPPLAFFGQNSRQSGYFAARMLMLLARDEKEIVIFRKIHEGIVGSNQQENREIGFRQYMEEYHPSCTILELDLHAERNDEDNEMLDEFFRTYPTVKNGITFNSKAYIVGEYLQSRGKKDFNLIGYDLLERNVTCLKEGSISFLIAQQPELQGANGIKALCDHLIFKKEVTCINYMPIDLLTVETIDYYHSK